MIKRDRGGGGVRKSRNKRDVIYAIPSIFDILSVGFLLIEDSSYQKQHILYHYHYLVSLKKSFP